SFATASHAPPRENDAEPLSGYSSGLTARAADEPNTTAPPARVARARLCRYLALILGSYRSMSTMYANRSWIGCRNTCVPNSILLSRPHAAYARKRNVSLLVTQFGRRPAMIP